MDNGRVRAEILKPGVKLAGQSLPGRLWYGDLKIVDGAGAYLAALCEYPKLGHELYQLLSAIIAAGHADRMKPRKK